MERCMEISFEMLRSSIRTGCSFCGVKLESIEEPLMKEIRYLDKLVDELVKGKAMEKIKRTNK